MSYDKTMEDLLATARSLPAELSLSEVEFIFLNPTSPAPAKRPWWRGDYPKFLLMFTLLIALLGFLLPAQANDSEHQLSAFPTQETPLTYSPMESLPAPSGLMALNVPPIDIITPEVRGLAPKDHFAPATAPEKESSPQNQPLIRKGKKSPSYATPPPTGSTRMPGALFSGQYSQVKDNLLLTFQEKENGPVNVLSPGLSAAELKLFKNSEADPLLIKRAAGSLLLYGGKNTGTFEFLPNTAYRESLNALGWGDAAAPDSVLVMVTLGKLSKEERQAGGRRSVEPYDQLWFRYFSMDVKNDYIGLLRQAGYNDSDLGSLWKLANGMINYEKLEEMLKLTSSVLSDTPPIEGLADLKYDLDDLKKMKSRGQRMTYGEFRKKNYQPLIFKALTGVLGDTTKNKAIKASYARNWSLELPGTTVDTINLLPGMRRLKLKGNFKVRINKDVSEGSIVAWGPKKAIRALKKRADHKTAIIINKRKRRTIYLDVPPAIDLMMNPNKRTSVERLNGKN